MDRTSIKYFDMPDYNTYKKSYCSWSGPSESSYAHNISDKDSLAILSSLMRPSGGLLSIRVPEIGTIGNGFQLDRVLTDLVLCLRPSERQLDYLKLLEAVNRGV